MNWGHKLQNIPENGDKKNLWQVAKFCKNKNRDIPPLKHNGELYVSPEEKSELMAGQFESFHQNPYATNGSPLEATVNQAVRLMETLPAVIDPDDFPTPEELVTYKSKLKSSKAPGMDKITNTVTKQLPFQALKYMYLYHHMRLLKSLLLSGKMETCNRNTYPESWERPNIRFQLPTNKSSVCF